MGPDNAEDVMVVLGKHCDGDKSKLLCPAGKINTLPDPPTDPVALQRTNGQDSAVFILFYGSNAPINWHAAVDGDSKFSRGKTLCRCRPAEENRWWGTGQVKRVKP